MPIECLQLEGQEEPFQKCPKCGKEPFESFALSRIISIQSQPR